MEFDIGNASFENLPFTLWGVPSSHLPMEEQGELAGHSQENMQSRLEDHFHSEDSALRVNRTDYSKLALDPHQDLRNRPADLLPTVPQGEPSSHSPATTWGVPTSHLPMEEQGELCGHSQANMQSMLTGLDIHQDLQKGPADLLSTGPQRKPPSHLPASTWGVPTSHLPMEEQGVLCGHSQANMQSVLTGHLLSGSVDEFSEVWNSNGITDSDGSAGC